jgi:hypothetical protein
MQLFLSMWEGRAEFRELGTTSCGGGSTLELRRPAFAHVGRSLHQEMMQLLIRLQSCVRQSSITSSQVCFHPTGNLQNAGHTEITSDGCSEMLQQRSDAKAQDRRR